MMNAPYELRVRLLNGQRDEFEAALHDFVALEANKPRGESSSIFVRYDQPTGCWILGFDTLAALEAFHDHWRESP